MNFPSSKTKKRQIFICQKPRFFPLRLLPLSLEFNSLHGFPVDGSASLLIQSEERLTVKSKKKLGFESSSIKKHKERKKRTAADVEGSHSHRVQKKNCRKKEGHGKEEVDYGNESVRNVAQSCE